MILRMKHENVIEHFWKLYLVSLHHNCSLLLKSLVTSISFCFNIFINVLETGRRIYEKFCNSKRKSCFLTFVITGHHRNLWSLLISSTINEENIIWKKIKKNKLGDHRALLRVKLSWTIIRSQFETSLLQ